MSTLGKNGMKRVAELSTQKAHYLADAINILAGFSVKTEYFFNEFVVEVPGSSKILISKATEAGFFPGIALSQFERNSENLLLVAVTEKRSKQEMDDLVAFLKGYTI